MLEQVSYNPFSGNWATARELPSVRIVDYTSKWIALNDVMAADSGLLSPELAAGIHRVNGVRKLGSRLGDG